MTKNSLDHVKNFYNERFKEKGDVLESVGWGNPESQKLRFDILFRNIEVNGKTILDVGCGFGDLISYLQEKGFHFKYIGIDISSELLKVANERHKDNKNISFYEGDILTIPPSLLQEIDISVLSGALTYKIEDNLSYAKNVLTKMFDLSSFMAASNFMTTYSDFQHEKNFHYSPEEIFTFSKSLSKKVTLIHDYPLYEFTTQIFK